MEKFQSYWLEEINCSFKKIYVESYVAAIIAFHVTF